MSAALTFGVAGSGPGCGKDTVADIICELLEKRGMGPRRERFATPVRECIAILTGVSVAESQTVEGKNRHLKGWDMTVGQMLQKLGTDAVRDNVHPDAWVLAAFQRLGDDDNVVFSDVRFPNEAEAIRGRGGFIVMVNRRAANAADSSYLAGRDPAHASETSLDGFQPDIVVDNNGTLETLRQDVDRVVGSIIDGRASDRPDASA